jgi:ribose transport system substrate-binding protein
MRVRNGLGLALLATTALGLAACGGAGDEGADGEEIALFTKNQTNPYFQSIRVGADAAARQMGARIVHYVPTRADSIPEQMSQIEDVIVKRPDAIVFIPVDHNAMVPGVEKMTAAGIPVVNLTDRSASGRFVSFVGCDDRRLGRDAGRYLLDRLNGRGGVIILEGVGGSNNSALRVSGFRDAIDELPDVRLLASQPGNFQRLQALQVTENLLQAHAQVDGILAANDSMALGAIEALQAADRTALVVGINGTKEAVDAIKTGALLASSDCNGFVQGCIGAMAAIRHLRGMSVPAEFQFTQPVVDAANYAAWDAPDEQRSCPVWESVMATDAAAVSASGP